MSARSVIEHALTVYYDGDRKLARKLLAKRDAEQLPEPLVVSRYDTAMEPAPEEEPVLTVGEVAEDGRPVARCASTQRRVGRSRPGSHRRPPSC